MTRAIRTMFVTLVLSLSLSGVAIAQGSSARATEIFTARLAAIGAPAAQLVVLREGDVVLSVNHGFIDRERRVPTTEDTRFRIGSVSKLITVAALLQLVDAGRVDLDAPVTRWVPEFSRGDSVTPRLLAGHLAGVRHYVPQDFMRPPRRYERVTDALDIFVADSLRSRPGTRYLYSSYGYNLLGAVVERASGVEFREFVAQAVLRRAGMAHTLFERADSTIAALAEGFSPVGTDSVRPTTRSDLSDRWPSGGALASARDMARLAEWFRTTSAISDTLRAAAFTPGTLPDGASTGVGLGWRVGTDPAGRTVHHHGGASEGGRAMLVTWPREGLTVAITTNLSPDGARVITERDAMAIGDAFLSAPAPSLQ